MGCPASFQVDREREGRDEKDEGTGMLRQRMLRKGMPYTAEAREVTQGCLSTPTRESRQPGNQGTTDFSGSQAVRNDLHQLSRWWKERMEVGVCQLCLGRLVVSWVVS